MDIIPLRSPRYEILTTPSGAVSAKLELTIDSTLRYTITKSCTAGETVTFEISELCRDYLDDCLLTNIAGTIATLNKQIEISRAISFYDGANATGSIVQYDGADTNTVVYNGFGGYGNYEDGANYEIPKGASDAFLLTKLNGAYEVFAPKSTTARTGATDTNDDIVALTNVTSGTSDSTYTYRSTTLSITVLDCSRYTPTEVAFINKKGAIQSLFFMTKKVDKLNTKQETYQRNTIDTSATTPTYFAPLYTTYSTYPHPINTYNKNGKQSYTLSSGYYPERANPYFEELLLSENVWIVETGYANAVTVKTSSMTYKTSLNERLIEYTIDFESAYDYINNVR
jgi:hypothetical protein